MFDEETQERLEGKDLAMVELVAEGMKMRHEAKRLEEKSKALTAEANALLAPVLTALEVDKLTAPGVGTVTFVKDIVSTTVDRKTMEKYMLEHGVSAELIKKAREAATTTRAQEYQIRFKG